MTAQFLHWWPSFRFAEPRWLWLLALIPLVAWLRGRVAPVASVPFSSSELLRSASRPVRFTHGRVLVAIRFLALALLITAMARPQMEKALEDDEAKGINIMLTLDFSGTMSTRDFTMNGKRVTRAAALIKVIQEFLRARPHDRIGAVRFDAEAFLVCPLTLDHQWLIDRLSQEKTGHGTATGSGMVIAAEHLIPATNQTKVIIVVTDADQVNRGPDPEEVGRALVKLGIKLHLIQIVDFKDMIQANPQLNFNPLPNVARMTGGQLFQVADFAGLRSVYRQIDLLEKADFKEDKQKDYRELMVWLAAPALGLLLLELLLRQTLWRRLP